MNITFNINLQDWKLFQAYHDASLKIHSRSKFIKVFVNLILWAFIGFVFMSAFGQLSKFHWPSALSVFIFSLLLYALSVLKYKNQKKYYEPSKNGTLLGEHSFTFNENGIYSKGNEYSSVHNWKAVKRIDQTSELIIIYIDTINAFIIPKREIKDSNAFYENVIDLHKKYNKPPQPTPKIDPAEL